MEWIKVKDKKPSYGHSVIVALNAAGCSTWVQESLLEKTDRDGDHYANESRFGGRKVTHWMELPEPPKD